MESKSEVCININFKDTKPTRHIAKIENFVRNCDKFKMHKIDGCEGGLQLAEIVTKNVGENYLNYWAKYIMIWLENW